MKCTPRTDDVEDSNLIKLETLFTSQLINWALLNIQCFLLGVRGVAHVCFVPLSLKSSSPYFLLLYRIIYDNGRAVFEQGEGPAPALTRSRRGRITLRIFIDLFLFFLIYYYFSFLCRPLLLLKLFSGLLPPRLDGWQAA